MRDMFDEFMEELRRRQAQLEGKSHEPGADKGKDAAEPGEPAAGEESQPSEGQARQAGQSPNAQPEEETVTSMGSDSGDQDYPSGSDEHQGADEEPRRIRFGGGRGSGGFGGPFDEYPEFHVSRGWVIVGAVIVAFFVLAALFSLSVGILTDAIWFNSVGFGSVFWTRIWSQVGSFVAGTLVAFLFVWFNLWLAGRLIPKGQLRRFSIDEFLDRFNVERYTGGGFGSGPFGRPGPRPVRGREEVTVPNISRPVFWVLIGFALLLALGLGGLLASNWTTIQLYLHRTPFGQTDPSYGLDISFYLFNLPFLRLLQTYANSVLLLAFVMTGIRYLVAVVSGASMPTPARVQLGVLFMLYLWTIAIGYQLDRYELVYSGTSDIFQGVSYTDAVAKVLAINVMTGIVLFIGAMVAYLAYAKSATPLMLVLVAWLGAYFVLEVGYPFAIQRFVVAPNQQVQESPYIKANIDMTRLAFNVNGWKEQQDTSIAPTITRAAVNNTPGTILNVRLWDTSPLQTTLDQVQIFRSYYTFTSVNTDRYTFNDAANCAPAPAPCVRQVMLAGRELDPTKLSDQSWINEHITYTHGTGLAMVPINDTGSEGRPNLLIQDLPTTNGPGAPTVTQPRIYFGLQESNYVIVGAASQEFDYPTAGGDQYFSWTGKSGIKLDTPLMRLLYAAKFGDLNLLISNQITGSSQLLYNRSIMDRVTEIAPYLRFDNDPYLVATPDGQLFYMLDAYTTSAQFPDAQPYSASDAKTTGLAGDAFNYIRNSVKIVMNAYDGSMSFYVADPNDPIIKAWQGVFPDVYKPLTEMPKELQSHIRYPQDIFDAQNAMYARYHVTDPGVFYNKAQFWAVPQGGDLNGSPVQLPLESFYVEMRVPGNASDTFMLLQPMVLQGRNNMISWVAAYNDYPSSYGQVNVIDFPENSNIFGPVQMQALVRQNKDISQQITLWDQSGSRVVLGNLLVIPLQDTLMYVEPVYLQSTSNALPVFRKVIVGTPTQVVWGDTLQDALNQIYAGQGTTNGGPATPGTSPTPAPSASSSAGPSTPSALPSVDLNGTAQQLIAEANAHYQAAQEALKAGDLGKYQSEMNIVGAILNQLGKTVGTPPPGASALPSASAAPVASPSGQ